MTTIKDVARLANVTHSTVSHALSGKRPVAPETRERILTAIRALNYHPNAAALSLVSRRTHTVGLSLPLDEPTEASLPSIFLPFITHICLRLNHHGYKLLFLNAREDGGRSLLSAMYHGDVDGVLLLDVQTVDPRVDALRDAGFPFVAIGRPRQGRGVIRVDGDAEDAGALAARHLFDLGHRHIAFLGQAAHAAFHHHALTGVRRAHAAYGLSLQRSRILALSSHTVTDVRAALSPLLAADPAVTALVVASDLAAVAALRVLADYQRRVPADMSLVALCESVLTVHAQPTLTAIRLPIAEGSQRAVDLLVGLLDGRRPSSMEQILPVTLQIGDSTGRIGLALAPRRDEQRAVSNARPLSVREGGASRS